MRASSCRAASSRFGRAPCAALLLALLFVTGAATPATSGVASGGGSARQLQQSATGLAAVEEHAPDFVTPGETPTETPGSIISALHSAAAQCAGPGKCSPPPSPGVPPPNPVSPPPEPPAPMPPPSPLPVAPSPPPSPAPPPPAAAFQPPQSPPTPPRPASPLQPASPLSPAAPPQPPPPPSPSPPAQPGAPGVPPASPPPPTPDAPAPQTPPPPVGDVPPPQAAPPAAPGAPDAPPPVPAAPVASPPPGNPPVQSPPPPPVTSPPQSVAAPPPPARQRRVLPPPTPHAPQAPGSPPLPDAPGTPGAPGSPVQAAQSPPPPPSTPESPQTPESPHSPETLQPPVDAVSPPPPGAPGSPAQPAQSPSPSPTPPPLSPQTPQTPSDGASPPPQPPAQAAQSPPPAVPGSPAAVAVPPPRAATPASPPPPPPRAASSTPPPPGQAVPPAGQAVPPAYETADVALIFLSLSRVDAAAARGIATAVASVTRLPPDDVTLTAVLDYPIDAEVTLRGVSEAAWLAAASAPEANAAVAAGLSSDLAISDAACVRINATLGEVEYEAEASTGLTTGLRRRLQAAPPAAVVPIVLHNFGDDADAAATAAASTANLLAGGLGARTGCATSIAALGLPLTGIAAASAPRVSATCSLRLRVLAGGADAARLALLAAAASGELASALQTAGVSVTGVALVRSNARATLRADGAQQATTDDADTALIGTPPLITADAITNSKAPLTNASSSSWAAPFIGSGAPAPSAATIGIAVGAAVGGALLLAGASLGARRAWRRQQARAAAQAAPRPQIPAAIFDIGEDDIGGSVDPPTQQLLRVAVKRHHSGRLGAAELGASPSLRLRTPHTAGSSPLRQRSLRHGGSLLAETPRMARGSDGGHPLPGAREPRRSDALLSMALDGGEMVLSPRRRSRRFSTPSAHRLEEPFE